jgi:hypothetical protein
LVVATTMEGVGARRFKWPKRFGGKWRQGGKKGGRRVGGGSVKIDKPNQVVSAGAQPGINKGVPGKVDYNGGQSKVGKAQDGSLTNKAKQQSATVPDMDLQSQVEYPPSYAESVDVAPKSKKSWLSGGKTIGKTVLGAVGTGGSVGKYFSRQHCR